ncbi:hypothetical protein JCM19231_5273 [Vibrio ishigakensis]|uniref:Chitinase n=1 Tax=Vibrio ishigakensis TaxID=1481914 RepID=A0A0B8NXS8_9VIBR|nr:hypothetical protein JCM19231_5273 [Vibrio ishigakensis]
MKTQFSSKLLVCSVIGALSSYANATNLDIVNPGFETGNWDGWQDVDPSSISGDAHQGLHSAKISGSGASFSQAISVTPQTNYTFPHTSKAPVLCLPKWGGTAHNRALVTVAGVR